MPELPEVETVRRGLTETTAGRQVQAVDVLWQPSLPATRTAIDHQVLGRRIDRVGRRGKLLIVDLDGGTHLLVHLMMTGQLVVVEDNQTLFAGGHPSRSMLGQQPNATTRVVFGLGGSRRLYFDDGRKFGRIRLVDDEGLRADPFLARLGPEPLEDGFTAGDFRRRLARHRRAPIKAVLLDQTIVAGIGNIYADESLHRARLHPGRPAGELTPAESRRLHGAVRTTLRRAVEHGGTSFAVYVNEARGQNGFLEHARVFRRQGLPCRVCGTTIERIRVAGRGTNLCPHCQPAP